MVPHERYLEAGGVLAFPSISPAVRSAFAQSTRVCVSAGVIALVLTGGREVRHVNVTAIALALVLVVLCIALVWQWLEALVAVARRADEFRAAVFDALAHEATGPLGTLEIAATMLADHPEEIEQQQEIVSIISAEVARLRHWIGETIQMSGADRTQLVPNKASHDVRDLALAAVRTLGHRTAGRRISMESDQTVLLVQCDSEIIRRVLHLLLDNALKYSPSGSMVTISSTLIKDPGMIVLSVTDAGPGVPEDEQTRIFERHCRGSHNRSGIPGTGLGLASAKDLVESHGGRIWVTNRPEDAAFHFSLPVGNGVVA